VEKFSGQIPFVIIHHSYRPVVAFDADGCEKAMRDMQDFHQLTRGWNDIGYSFAVCGDGRIYRGRGYNVIGAHAPRYNDKSIGICLIGDWRSEIGAPIEINLWIIFGFLASRAATGADAEGDQGPHRVQPRAGSSVNELQAARTSASARHRVPGPAIIRRNRDMEPLLKDTHWPQRHRHTVLGWARDERESERLTCN
jgi:hypothetical protein